MCILCVCTLLEVVSHYGSSVLSMSVMGLKKKLEWGGWGELYPFLCGIFGICLTLQNP